MNEPNLEQTSLEIVKDKPQLVKVVAALLVFNSALLLFWWFFFAGDVQSNGAQLFFMILWLSFAWAVYHGLGGVRYALLLLIIVFVGEVINSRAPAEFLWQMSFDEKVTKAVGIICFFLLFTPAPYQWYRNIKLAYKAEEALLKKQKKAARET